MVLAAGRGTRMRPLTEVLPKPALPLPDGPVVASALKLASAAGALRTVVNVYHLGERMIEAATEVQIEGMEIVISREDELMGTAGGLALARERGFLGGAESVLVINGDGALVLDLDGFAEHHFGGGGLVTLALLPHLDPNRWSRVMLDSDGKVAAIHPPGPTQPHEVPFLYPGVMAVSREAIDALPSGPAETPSALWEPARKMQMLDGVVVSGHWREVGTPTDYLEIVRKRLAGASHIDPAADVSATALIAGSFIGRGAVIAEEAEVRDSIVAQGATVGRGAKVESSVVFGAVDIGQHRQMRGKFVGNPG